MAGDAFELMDGVPRVRLDEPSWAAVVAVSGVPPEQAGGLTPLAEPAAQAPDPDVGAAAALALAGPIHVDVTSVGGDAGVVASLGSDADVAAVAVRVLAVGLADSPTVAVPGVEVSLVRPQQIVSEIMRLLPADPSTADDPPTEAITLAHDQALVLSAALRDDDEPLALEIASQEGWSAVPELLRSLAADVSGNATVALRVRGSDDVVVRRWLQCDRGWVQVSVADGRVTHTPCDRSLISRELLYALTGAFEFALSGAGSHG